MTQRVLRFVKRVSFCLGLSLALPLVAGTGVCAANLSHVDVASSTDTDQDLTDQGGDVLKVRLGGTLSHTRIVIDLQKSPVGRLISDPDDMHGLTLNLSRVQTGHGVDGGAYGAVSNWSLHNMMGTAQLKLSFNGAAHVARRFVLPPSDGVSYYRYVIDIEASGADSNPLPSKPLADVRPSARKLNAVLNLPVSDPNRKKIIVVDAGHGGKDPGTLGADSQEKTINLAAARALRDRLESTGRYRVIMTRDTDSYVDLAARVRIARAANADLFISLHSDSSPNHTTRGASIYTLSDSGTERAARKALVAGDWTRSERGNDDQMVNRILIDLTQRATKNRSATFASMLLDRLDGTTPLLQASNRQAGFAVLLAPDVPAVLLEMGYMTNADDEARLNDFERREQMMAQVARAIDTYFDSDHGTGTLAALP